MSTANIKPASTAREAGFSAPHPTATRQRAGGMAPLLSDDDREWAVWLQQDAAYTYRMASEHRESGKPAAGWVASKIQEAAAHSAALARQTLGLDGGDWAEVL